MDRRIDDRSHRRITFTAVTTIVTITRVLGLAASLAVASTGCASAADDANADESVETADEAWSVSSSFVARGTGYYPDHSALEGGFNDRRGKPLQTLQQYLDGDADYVAVAMDSNAFKYGQRLRIRELETEYDREIVFRVVDTGGAFRGKGRTRIDICTENERASLDPTINGQLHIDAIKE